VERKKRGDGEPESKNCLYDLRTVIAEKESLKTRDITWKFVWQMPLNKFRSSRYLILYHTLWTRTLAPDVNV
jgi:hypothetical protein